MQVRVVIEWQGGDVGWTGIAHVPGRGKIRVRGAARPGVVRRRVRKALAEAGITGVELESELWIPEEFHQILREVEEAQGAAVRATKALREVRVMAARRLVSELHMSEADAGELLGLTGTYVGNLLKTDALDTDEFKLCDDVTSVAPAKKRATRWSGAG